MSNSSERFTELAMKLVSFECSAEEKAELRRFIDHDPARREELQNLTISVGIAREILPLAKALEATDGCMTASEIDTFKLALAKVREEQKGRTGAASPDKSGVGNQRATVTDSETLAPSHTAPKPVTELSRSSMRQLILKVLSETRMDGFELCRRLRQANVRIKDEPEAGIYRILDDLELSGHLESEWADRPTRRVKVYRLSQEIGWPLLRSERVPHDIAALVDAIKAFG